MYLIYYFSYHLAADHIGDLLCDGEGGGVGHPPGQVQCLLKGDIQRPLVDVAALEVVPAVMDVVCAQRAETAQIDGGNALVGKGDGVAGIDVQLDLAGGALLLHQAVHIAHRLVGGHHQGDVVAQGGGGNVHVDHQLVLLQLAFMGGGPGLTAQQTLLFRAVPVELQGAGGRILGEMPQQLHEDHAARNIVVDTGGEIHAVVVSAEGDDLLWLACAGNDGAHILGGAVVIFALQLQLEGLCTPAHQFGSVGGTEIHGNGIAKGLGECFPQLADIAVGVRQTVNGGAREGQNGGDAGLLQLFVVGTTETTVHQHDFALGTLQMEGQQIFGIIQLAFQTVLGGGFGTLVAGNFIFLPIGCGDGELGPMYLAAGHGKLLQMSLHAAGFGLLQQTEGGLFFFGRATDLFISQLFQQGKGAMGGNRHKQFLL